MKRCVCVYTKKNSDDDLSWGFVGEWCYNYTQRKLCVQAPGELNACSLQTCTQTNRSEILKMKCCLPQNKTTNRSYDLIYGVLKTRHRSGLAKGPRTTTNIKRNQYFEEHEYC